MATKVNIDLMPSKDRDNFIRLTRLLIAGGTRILRELFDSYHLPQHLASRLNSQRTLLETTAKLTRPQKESLFPASGVPDSKNFDLTLLVKLLRNICFSTTPTRGWDGFPDNDDVSLQDDVVRIHFYRNEIYAHVRAEMALSSEYFQKLWKEISKALCRIVWKLNINVNEIEKQIFKLRFSPLTNDETSKYIKEIQDTLAGHEETLQRHEEQFTCQADTLARHNEALSRIDAQGNQIHKEMKGLQDAQTSKPINSKKISENVTQNIGTQINLHISGNNADRLPQLFELMCNSSKQMTIENPSKITERSKSMDLNDYLHDQQMDRGWYSDDQLDHREKCETKHQFQFPTNLSEASAFSLPGQIPTCPKSRKKIPMFDQEQSGTGDLAGTAFIPWSAKPWSKYNNQRIHEAHRGGSYRGRAVFSAASEPDDDRLPLDWRSIVGDHSTPRSSSTPDCIGFFTQYPSTNRRLRSFTSSNSSNKSQMSGSTRDSKKQLMVDLSSQSFLDSSQSSPSGGSISSFSEEIKAYDDHADAVFYSIDQLSEPSKRHQDRSFQRPSSAPDCVNSSPGGASNNSEIYGRRITFSRYSRKQNNDDQDLHINVSCVRGNPSSRDFHLGRLVFDSLMFHDDDDDDGFRSYLEHTRNLRITEVDDSQTEFCSIGVSASDMSSLEELWRDYITNDLRQIIKEKVLLPFFDADIEVSIDGREYERCCKVLHHKPKLTLRARGRLQLRDKLTDRGNRQ